MAAFLISSLQGLPLHTFFARLKGTGQWNKDLLPILETMAALGRARRSGSTGPAAKSAGQMDRDADMVRPRFESQWRQDTSS